MKKRVLFVCVHNSARSQMAEAFLNEMCGEEFESQSAGLQPGELNPIAVQAMREVGIDISSKKTQAVSDVFGTKEVFDYVISVCDESEAQACPAIPGLSERLHWSFADPSALRGSYHQRLQGTRKIRDAIRGRIATWCEEICGVRA
jgi:arsenate reductase